MQSSTSTDKEIENDMVDDAIMPNSSSSSSYCDSPASSTCPLTVTSATSSAFSSPNYKVASTLLSSSVFPNTSPYAKSTPSENVNPEPLSSFVPDGAVRNTEHPKADDIVEGDVFQSRVTHAMGMQKETSVSDSVPLTPTSSPSRSSSFPSSWSASSRSVSSSSSLSNTSSPNTRSTSSSPHQTHLGSTMAMKQGLNPPPPAPTSLRLPRTLTKPSYKSVEPNVISALDPDLDGIPLPYIVNMLSRIGPRMIAALARTSATVNTGSGDSSDEPASTSTLPRELVVTVAPDSKRARTTLSSNVSTGEPDIDIEFDTLPTHLLAVYSRSSGNASAKSGLQPGSSDHNQRRKVTLFPTHGIVLAAHCAHLPALPQGRNPSVNNDIEKGEKRARDLKTLKRRFGVDIPESIMESECESEIHNEDRDELGLEESNDGNGNMKSSITSSVQVTLPVIPLCIPSPGTFPLLQAYLYTKRTDKLLATLIPAVPSFSRSYESIGMTAGPGSLSHTQPSTSASTFIASPADLSKQLSAAFLPNVLLAATLRTHELWANITALGIFDDNLWRAVNYAWKVLMEDDYKAAKEAFVSYQNGSSIFHILAVSSVSLSSLVLYSTLKARVSSRRLNVFSDYTILVLPLLLSMTIGAESPLMLNACIILLSGILAMALPHSLMDYLPSSRPSSPQPVSHVLPSDREQPEVKDRSRTNVQVSALTTYRSHMLLMTFLAILAVDFPIFPRNLAKCETFGMDIGVGSFVFSQGIMSAKAFVKNPSYLASPVPPKILNAIRRVFPMILLGFVRVIFVKGSDYPEHVSEYGVHWNFFLSMAALPVFEIILHPLLYRFHVLIIALSVTLIHQLVLSKTPLQEWTLNAPRDNIISQNKEGIVSLPGYLAIHMLGLLTGTIVLPSSPSDFKRLKEQSKTIHSSEIPYKERPRQDGKTAVELCSYAIVWWFLLLSANATNIGQGVSRQLANTRYVFWVAAYNTTFITAYFILDIIFSPASPSKKSKKQNLSPSSVDQTSYFQTPSNPQEPSQLIQAINKNGLALFLLANAATGLINLTVKTLYTSDTTAFLILLTYSFGLSGIAWIFKGRRILISGFITGHKRLMMSTPGLEKEYRDDSLNRHARFISKTSCVVQDNNDGKGKEGVDRLNGDQGKLLPTTSHLFKLLIPFPKSVLQSSTKPSYTAYLLHPSQPLSHISRLIAPSLPWEHSNISFRSIPPDDSFSPHVEVEWSDSTDLGDFIKSVASAEHFKIVISPSEQEQTLKSREDIKEIPGLPQQDSDSLDSSATDMKRARSPNPQDIIITVQVPSYQDRTQFLRRRLSSIDTALGQMETLKQRCDREAQRGARRMAMSGFGMLVVYWFGVARLTFWDYGWDIMEPITYLSGLSTVICGYLWFLYKGREVSYTSVLSQSVSARRVTLYKAKGFDLERWADLIAERKALRREMNKIAEDYDIQWDGKWEDSDEFTKSFDTKNEEKEQIKEQTIQSDVDSQRNLKAIRINGDSDDDHDKLEGLDRKASRE